MVRTRGLSARILGTLVAGLVVCAPGARADDPPPANTGATQSPLDPAGEFRAPEKDLMPAATEKVDADLDGPFAFAYLCRMSGDWENDDGAIAASFRTTAGGSALVETLFPGSADEVTSVYYIEAGDLVADVFAPGGHRIRFKFDPRRSFAGKYWFSLSGGTGFNKSKDLHLHEKTLQFTGLNRIDVEVTRFEGKTRADARLLTLSRKGTP